LFFLVFDFFRKEYQTESKRSKTSSMIFLGLEDTYVTWREGQKSPEEATSLETPPKGGASLACGPLEGPPTIILALYILKYSPNIRSVHKNTFPPPQASVLVRSHLGAFSSDLSEGDLIMEGFYINLTTLPMMCE
jgi:hypothetical protein